LPPFPSTTFNVANDVNDEPKYFLVVPNNPYERVSPYFVPRESITDDAWARKIAISCRLGYIFPNCYDVYYPVERRFESVAHHFEEIRDKYPLLAETIHLKLRDEAEYLGGWHDFLFVLATNHAASLCTYLRQTNRARYESVMKNIMKDFQGWFDNEGRKLEEAVTKPEDVNFLAAADKAIEVVNYSASQWNK